MAPAQTRFHIRALRDFAGDKVFARRRAYHRDGHLKRAVPAFSGSPAIGARSSESGSTARRHEHKNVTGVNFSVKSEAQDFSALDDGL
jgi:hypothetical protein